MRPADVLADIAHAICLVTPKTLCGAGCGEQETPLGGEMEYPGHITQLPWNLRHTKTWGKVGRPQGPTYGSDLPMLFPIPVSGKNGHSKIYPSL